MKNRWIFIFTGSVCVTACKNHNQAVAPLIKAEKKNYFPIADFIKSEIRYVDSLPLALIKYNIQNNHTDSSFIKPAEFDQLAQEFLPPVLSGAAFEDDYTETSFMDATTQLAAFTYSTKNRNQELQRADVLAKPNPGINQVQSIYMEKVLIKSDTVFVKKITWKAGKSFQVLSSIQPPGQKPVMTQLKVTWDDSE
jgi:hypothetical protein